MNWFFITGTIVHLVASNAPFIKWIILRYIRSDLSDIQDLIFELFSNTCECIALYEYILLILYLRWMVYIINGQIPKKHSTISTFRDMYLELIECLNDINKSIYGVSILLSFIGANVSQVLLILYYHVFFPDSWKISGVTLMTIISTRLFNIILLYGIGDATEKEINRMTLVLNQRSMIERNPRIKRQIKFFILRRLHEHFHFKVYGVCGLNLRELLILFNRAIGYLVMQILLKLNKN
ncbi:uncharacterized protein LOC111028235 [Myzus persicae]|uniref:uncharacterized protein LOC111028235 n=1 Tax=Myzus persicae TaxID=13164 RepID=UPI000B935D90|nr:uncharacterized protein LOC111028235 [Myzus persicae]